MSGTRGVDAPAGGSADVSWGLVCLALAAVGGACGVKELPRAGGQASSRGGSAVEPAGGGGGATAGGSTGAAGGTGGGAGGGGAPTGTDGGRADVAGPPATSSGPPGVIIAGQAVERGRAIVFLHIGHSNMAGRATGPAALLPYFTDTHPQLWGYAAGGSFRPAKEPLAPDKDTGMRAGPGMALLRSAQASAAAGTYFISIGHGHSGTYGGNCANFRKGGLFYDVVMKPALELKGRVTYGGIFSMFGQSEHRVSSAQQQAFAACMKAIAEDMRGDLGDPEVPFMVGDYERGISRPDIAPGGTFGKLLIAQMAMIPQQVTRAALIPTEGLAMEDDHHFDMAGHKGWGERAIEILLARGWAAWPRQ